MNNNLRKKQGKKKKKRKRKKKMTKKILTRDQTSQECYLKSIEIFIEINV